MSNSNPPTPSTASYKAMEEGFGAVTDDAIAAMVKSRWEASKEHYSSYRNQLPEWYALFHCLYVDEVAEYKNNIGLPIAFSHIMADVAKKVNSVFGAWPVVTFQGYNPEMAAIAKKNEVLVSAQLKDCRSLQKAVDFFIMADLYGTGVARVGWSYLERWRTFRVPTSEGVQEQKIKVIVNDGPDWTPLNPADCGPEPGKRFIPEMNWFTYRYYEDLDTLREMNASAIEATGRPLFKGGALGKLVTRPIPSIEDMKWTKMGMPWMTSGRPDPSAYSKPVEIVEHWGLVPREMAPDGDRNRVIVIANGHTLLRNDPNPHWNGLKPFISCTPMPDPHSFWGIGKAKVIAPLQGAAARITNQKLDTLDLFGSPQTVFDVTKMQHSGPMYAKPGRMIPVRGKPSDVFMPLPVDLGGMALAFNEVASLEKYAEKASGVDETVVMGMGGSDRATAREVMIRSEAANTRLGLESFLLSAEFIEPLAEWFRDMNQQYLELPKEIAIIGHLATINPITGMPLPIENPTIFSGELNHNWNAKAVGPMLMLTKSMQRQDAIQLLGAFSTNPALFQISNWVSWAKKLYSLYDWDPSEMLVQMIPMLNEMTGGGGAGATGGGDPMAGGMQGGAGGSELDPSQSQGPQDTMPEGP